MKVLLYSILLLFCAVTNLYSQKYNIRHYRVEDGLLHSFVNDIIQDSRGSVWIATGGGLCKFNGVEFQSYTTAHGLNYSRILCLEEDVKNNIWIGSLQGINVFDGDTIFSLIDTEMGDMILDLEKSYSGKMWVATHDGVGSVTFTNGELTYDKLPFDFGDSREAVIFQDRSQNTFLLETAKRELFIGFNGVLSLFMDGKLERIISKDSIEVFSACEMSDGKIIFGTSNGIYTYEEDELNKINTRLLEGFEINKICSVEDKLWLTGKQSNSPDNESFLMSINLSDKDYFRKIGVINGLINQPTSLFIDHENNIWTGSNGGLSVLCGESFVNYNKSTGLIGNKIWGLHQDAESRIWIGTIGEGLSIIEGDKITNFTTINGLPDMSVSTFYHDKKDTIWFGTKTKGLCIATYRSHTDDFSFNRLPIELNQGETRVDDILRDNNGVLWIASNKGLYYSDDDIVFKRKSLFMGDSEDTFVHKLLLSDKGELYIATKKHGVFVKDSSGIRNILHDENSDLTVSSICKDSEGNIWLCSLHRGILKLNEKPHHWITDRDGLKSNVIYILQADNHGSLWIGSNLGLDKLDVKEYNKSGKIIIRHYDTDDGLNALEMNLNGSIIDHEDNLWFATNNGVVRYDYKYDVSNRVPPITTLSGLKIHSNDADWSLYSDSLTQWNHLPYKPVLSYKENHLTFDFVGISFKNPDEIIYTWKLEGFDDDWTPTSSNRQAIYSNLPYGNYKFRVKAANNDGVWNSEPIDYEFEILPPFWETWWFRVFFAVFIIGSIYMIVKWRTGSLKKRQKELRIMVDQRTSEITYQKEIVEEKNSEILSSINYAKRLQAAMLPQLDDIKAHFSDCFIFYKPKDVVSGDFYWFENIGDLSFIAVADCTGHGVPGAMVSLVCSNALYRTIKELGITEPEKILDKTRELVIHTFEKSSSEVKDGMDIAMCVIDQQTLELKYSGANNSLYHVRDYDLNEIKPDKQPIGKYPNTKPFTPHKLQLEKNDVIYMFSDGYADQYGGQDRKKFKYKQFRELIQTVSGESLEDQYDTLNRTFVNWKGNTDQIDDICVIGLRI